MTLHRMADRAVGHALGHVVDTRSASLPPVSSWLFDETVLPWESDTRV